MAPSATLARRDRLLYVISAAAFLVFFQTFMVAPILPAFAMVFHVSVTEIGLIVPAYLIPYGASTLLYGPLSDRFGRKPILFTCFSGFIALTALTAISQNAGQMIVFRVLAGAFSGGIVPIALALISDLFAYSERGRAIGWLFGAMAGGMAFGSTFGALLEPIVSWPRLFLGVAVLIAFVFVSLFAFLDLLTGGQASAGQPSAPSGRAVLYGYASLLRSSRAVRTYSYVLLNGLFHSGVYTWLGYMLAKQYGLGELSIGIALLGYGVPGFIFGPALGKLADNFGRNRLIPLGLLIAGASSMILAVHTPLLVVGLVVAALSLGYDMTQPLLAGIVTDLSPNKGQAIGMMAFVLFLGFGLGSLVFSAAMQLGLAAAFYTFGAFALLLAVCGSFLYRNEIRR